MRRPVSDYQLARARRRELVAPPPRISHRLAARLLRLPLKGGVILAARNNPFSINHFPLEAELPSEG